jgi:pSer/pThr/pTyr-binding forkhead associated (FHA) protein
MTKNTAGTPGSPSAEEPYDDRHVLALCGTGELGEGSHLPIRLGESVVVGRSRHCDWSLKRTPGWLRKPDAERVRIRKSLPWRATSRRHCRISYIAPDIVDVENLSINGTIVDGHKVDRIVLTDCRRHPHSIRLGPDGVTLQLRHAGNGHE